MLYHAMPVGSVGVAVAVFWKEAKVEGERTSRFPLETNDSNKI